MAKNVKIRKGPVSSAGKFSIGTRKKGNDGNMWKIVENKNGTKRWLKISSVKSVTKKSKRILKLEKDPNSVWGKNKKLENFWRKLASGTELVLVHNDGKIVKFMMPKTPQAKNNKHAKFEDDNNVKAIITSARSTDTYESLYKKVKNKTPEEIIKNYKKYLTNYGNDKRWFL
jgi:ribosomal protein L24E|tara:strand:+ start:144 stop:659 length:516 start_codon:yes stop_codon:yes gene_type:complete